MVNAALRAISFLFPASALLHSAAAPAQPISVVDDRGKAVRLEQPARRIVALAPHLTELTFAAGAGPRLVGVARFSDFPAVARDLPEVGDAARVELERILLLKPDLILAWKSGSAARDVGRLERLGLPVFVSEPARLPDIPRLLRAIGVLAGTAADAERAASRIEREIRALRNRHAAAPRVRVFYEIWHRPLMTVNGVHIISDVIALCGGENVFADVSQLTPTVSLEAVLAAHPEAILGGGSAGGAERFAGDWRASAIPALRVLPAYYIDPDLIQRPAPRIVEGARTVCAALEQVRINRQDAKTPRRQEKQDENEIKSTNIHVDAQRSRPTSGARDGRR